MIKNFTAAVSNCSNKIRKIAEEQPAYFRTYYFNNLLIECQELLLQLIQCKGGSVAFLTASGTGAMNASIINLTTNKDKILVINGGSFGQKWEDLCSYYNLNYRNFNVEFGKDLSLIQLEKTIIKNKPTIILTQHNETSSMQLYPIREIGKLCEKYHIKLIVDAISSFAIDEYKMDAWNVYATIITTNKGVGTYPGLSAVILSKDAKLHHSSDYYFDLNKYIQDNNDISLPFTPNIIAIKQLHHQLTYFKKVGIDNIVRKINKRACHFRKLIKGLPFRIAADTPSNCGTTLYTERTDVKSLFEKLQKKNIYFTPSGGMQGKKFIIAHIGEQTLNDNRLITGELKKWLKA